MQTYVQTSPKKLVNEVTVIFCSRREKKTKLYSFQKWMQNCNLFKIAIFGIGFDEAVLLSCELIICSVRNVLWRPYGLWIFRDRRIMNAINCLLRSMNHTFFIWWWLTRDTYFMFLLLLLYAIKFRYSFICKKMLSRGWVFDTFF